MITKEALKQKRRIIAAVIEKLTAEFGAEMKRDLEYLFGEEMKKYQQIKGFSWVQCQPDCLKHGWRCDIGREYIAIIDRNGAYQLQDNHKFDLIRASISATLQEIGQEVLLPLGRDVRVVVAMDGRISLITDLVSRTCPYCTGL